MSLGNAWPGIVHSDFNRAAHVRGFDRYFASIGEFDCIPEEIQ
jgi:hypothetical protein